MVAKPAAKRGRPKKTEQEKPVEEKPATTAKRGRPKKETTAAAETKPKASRGRPNKQTSSTAQTQTAAKKRGRPRKTQDSLDEIKKLNEQILEENLKLQRQQAELNSALGITLSQLDIKRAEDANQNAETQPENVENNVENENQEPVTVDSNNNENN